MNLFHRTLPCWIAASLASGIASAGLAPIDSTDNAPQGKLPAVTLAPASSDLFADAFGMKTTDKEVAKWEQRVKVTPDDSAAFVGLATAYLQKARESNDPSYYTRAEKSLSKAQELKSDNYAAMHLQADLHSTRHQFTEAIQWVEKAIKINPDDPMNYGLLSDIYAELGDYDKAEDNTQKMLDMRPGRASYSRGSYIRELFGDDREAVKLMRMAIAAGPPKGEGTAWCHTYLGNLYFNEGFLPAAEQEYNMALDSFPGYFRAYAYLGKVKAARKEYPAAIDLYEKALKSGPYHEALGALIELYSLTGQKAMAESTHDRLSALNKKYHENGMEIDFEVAEIDAIQGKDLPHALELAKDEVKTHANIRAYDGLAWIAYLNHDLPLAKSAMDQALRTGARNALMFYHAAKIQEALGDKEESIFLLNKCISRCPYFDVRYSDDAQKLKERLTEDLVASVRAR